MASPVTIEMQTFKSRLETFERPQQLSKRRASSQSKKKAQTIEWPHEYPEPEQLARAGFFYKPTLDSPDNVQCFMCAVRLDGWEATDSPLQEHLAHSHSCAWATTQSVARQDGEVEETRDPMSEELVAARHETFRIGEGWAHEKKNGWKCKTTKMVAAGWCFDPSPETEDGVTCFYCNLSLDGWEPKDNPLEEHRRRGPDCPFFVLLDRYAADAPVKTKAKGKGRGRPSNASRMSTQSMVSVVPSEPPSMDEMSQMPGEDDSIMTTGTVTSQAGGKKKKAAAKPKGKGKKKVASVEPEPEPEPEPQEVEYPDLSMERDLPEVEDEDDIRVSLHSFVPAEPEPPKPKRGRPKGSRNSKAADSSIMEASQPEPAPKKATRGRKPKAESEPEPEVEPEMPEDVFRQASSEVDLQLQEELDQSMDLPDAESTPQALTAKPKRGAKRTSDGLQKQEQESSIVAGLEFPAPPKPAPAPKAKRGRKPKVSTAVESGLDACTQETLVISQPEKDTSILSTDVEAAKPAKAKKAPAKKGKGRKASSTRSSKTTIVTEPEPAPEEEDLDRDEREIEAELERIATEQRPAEEAAAIQTEQDNLAEFEPSPSRPSSKLSQAAAHIHALEQELQHEAEHISHPGQNMAEYVASVAAPSPASPNVVIFEDSPAPSPPRATPSPARSDKENIPSSALPAPTTALKLQHQHAPQIYLSPTKTTRIPLAPSTPNKHASPTRHLSPSKQQLQHLTSTHPWESIDIEALLLASPQPTPGRLGESLAAAAGGLSAKEKGMTVEQWVMYRAELGEEGLRRKCEGLVERFEREGVRGLEALQGLGVVG